jgi:gliding motility-associated-like protein
MSLLCKIFFVLMLFTTTTVFAQLPNNIGFEKGNFDGWETSIGTRNRTVGSIDIMDPPAAPVNGRHVIIDAAYNKNELDPYGGFPVVCPNGSKYSIKLGNNIPAGKMQRVSYTFTVPSNITSYSIIFNYAVVIEDPNHSISEQPIFSAKVYNVSDNSYVSCPALDFSPQSGIPGFDKSDITRVPVNNGPIATVYYKDWSTAMIDLTNYAGKTIRLEFTATDCKPSGHFGYAYLDIDEQLSLKPITGNVFCSNQTVVTLNGPSGFAEYMWYKDNDTTKPGISGQSITVPAIDGDKYALHIIPYLGLGCEDDLYVMLQKLAEPFNLVVTPQVYGCPGTGIDLTAASIKAGSSSMKFSYYKDKFGVEYLPNPDRILSSGIYYIRGTNLGGCTDVLPVEVIIASPEISVTQPLPVRYPTKVDLSATFTHISGVTYDYFTDATATEPMVDFSINVSGTYYIKATSGTPCSVIVPVKVVVNPPLPYTIEAPSAFTPNGDGINDNFSIKITGYVSMTLLNIFNRYGQVVFTTKSINDYWTGTSSGSTLPNGTYYWIFEGTDDYFHTRVKQASSITIVR